MTPYLVVKVLESQSISLPSTFIYGDVEMRSAQSDTSEELEIMKASAQNLNLDFSKYGHCARVSTIVKGTTLEQAIALAEDRFAEILDLKSIEATMSDFSVSKIGFIKDLLKGSLHEINVKQVMPCMAFYVHQGDVQRKDMTNYILALDNELSRRYLRSMHWLRNSRRENNSQIKILFNWFAVEALLKESESDNVGPYIRWFLGFPNGKASRLVSDTTVKKLESHPRYIFWKSKIIDIIEKVRIFRNESIHHGFRSIDFSKKELELLNQVMTYGVTRCQGAVQSALNNRIVSVSEFKEYIPYIFEQYKNIASDVHNNIIFSLDRI